MIPCKLRLSNFLSYRGEAELDLRGIQVACLCGDNGHGKSALLDAMTWCLWGWARGHRYGQGGSSVDELVHQGRTDMEVSLDFLVDGADYRVVRKYSQGARARSSATILDLQMATQDGYRSLTEGGVLETEHVIQRLLHMDYETFLNSAFLLQGHADRFTTSTPARRKETLAEILGLSLYESLEERAKERGREHGERLLIARSDLERLEEQLGQSPEHQEALAVAQAQLAELEPSLEEAVSQVAGLRDWLRELERQKQEEEYLHQELPRIQSEVEQLDRQIQESRLRIDGYQKALGRRDEIEAGARALEETRRGLESLDAAQSEHTTLTQQKLQLEHQIAWERSGWESELEHLRRHIAHELDPRAQRLPQVEEALKDAAEALIALQGRESELDEQRQQLQRIGGRSEALEGDNQRLLQEMEELRGKLDLLGTSDATCPLCGTPLGPDGRAHLEGEITAQGQRSRDQYRQNEEEFHLLAKDLTALERQLRQEEAQLTQERGQLQARQGALGRELEECRRAAGELAQAKEQAQGLEKRLEVRDFAQEVREELKTLESTLASLGYDMVQHQEVRAQARTLEPFGELGRQLRGTQEQLPQEERSLTDLEALLQTRHREVERIRERMAGIAQDLKELPALEVQVGVLGGQQRRLEEQRIILQGEARLHNLHLQELERARERKGTLEEEVATLEHGQITYSLLAEAFGKRGVQALLIEAALPELENSANELLGRLTQGRMSLTLETQVQRRRGDVAETLEIRIADELGTRSYELFSGGEAFRINFALRIALAKLLAARAGAPLRSLFLDEGFGTQDAEGRERLVEAINSIQAEFDLILVITHIDELKEAFPVRIEVTKTEGMGSTFELVWS